MKKRSRLLAMIISSLLIIAIPVYFVVIAPMNGQGKVAAAFRVITVDINPSVQLTVDADDKVLEAEALNDDAKALLATLHLEGLPATEAVQLIVGAAVVLGYLDAAATDNYVAIAVEDDGDESTDDEQQLENDLKDSAEQGLADHDATGEIDMSEIVHERISAAATLGISPGRLNLIDRLAEALGQTREDVLAQYGEANVKTILKAIKAALGHGDPKDESSDPEATPGDSSTTPDVTGGATSVTGPADDDDDDDESDDEDDDDDEDDGNGASAVPTNAPTSVPKPKPKPTAVVTPKPTAVATPKPTAAPTPKPTVAPTVTPDVVGGATGK